MAMERQLDTAGAEKTNFAATMPNDSPPTAAGGATPEVMFSERAGQAWVRLQERTDAQIDPPGRAAMAKLPLAPGQRVLDVGCGCGQTLLQLAAAVGPGGRVVGVDVSPPMLGRAGELVTGHPEIELVLSDAQTYAFAPASFDAMYSRFGVMFFTDQRAAFANLRAALKPGGPLAFVCWQGMARNPWAAEPLAAVKRLIPKQALPDMLVPDRPGPFYMADPDRIRAILGDAGFKSIEVEAWEKPLHFGGAMTLDEVKAYGMQIGPAARAIAEAPKELHPALEEALGKAFAPYVTDRGVWMTGACWLVTARAPA
jgi:SAM-dependent methyltransferase